MKQKLKRIILLFCLLLISSIHADDGKWETLFNGKDLSGWKATFGEDSFTVVDGALKAKSTGRMPHLLYVGKDGKTKFKNFELIVVSKGAPNSNSGIYFHTTFELSNKKRGYLKDGYEVQLNSTKKEKRKTGSLYMIVDFDSSPVDETKWFETKIRVEGKRIQVWINGKQLVDHTEKENPERPSHHLGRLIRQDGGHIALQAHDPKSSWYFKEVKIKRLP